MKAKEKLQELIERCWLPELVDRLKWEWALFQLHIDDFFLGLEPLLRFLVEKIAGFVFWIGKRYPSSIFGRFI